MHRIIGFTSSTPVKFSIQYSSECSRKIGLNSWICLELTSLDSKLIQGSSLNWFALTKSELPRFFKNSVQILIWNINSSSDQLCHLWDDGNAIKSWRHRNQICPLSAVSIVQAFWVEILINQEKESITMEC
jgi:hypothetical protein